MQKYFERVSKAQKRISEEMKVKNEMDNIMIQKSLEVPKLYPEEIKKKFIFERFGTQSNEYNSAHFAKMFRIDNLKGKDILKEEVGFIMNSLDKVENGQDKEILKELKEKNFKYVTYKAFLLEMRKNNKNTRLNHSLRILSKVISIKESKEVFQGLLEYLEKKLEGKKNEITEEKGTESEKEKVPKEIENKERTEQPQKEKSEEQVPTFFTEINSSKTDYLMDKLLNLVNRLENQQDREEEFFLLKNLLKFLKNQGLSPIKKIGEELQVKLKDLEFGEYIGTPFELEEEKRVKIERAGWRYKREVISPILYSEIRK